MNVLGISAYYHDSAAAIVRDGVIVNAAQEERFTRKKHDPGFPVNAIQWCLADAGVAPREVDRVAFYDKPFLKFERLLETYLAFAPRGFQSFRTAMPVWLSEKLFQKDMLLKELRAIDKDLGAVDKLLFRRASLQSRAPRPSTRRHSKRPPCSPWTASANGRRPPPASGAAASSTIAKEIHFPHSLGLLYSAFTYYTGFKVNSGEYKVMGLAPYGEPKYAQDDPRQSDRPEGRRLVPAQPRLFRLLHRADHDQRALRCAVRRPAAQAGSLADATRDGPRRLDPGGDRGSRAAAGAFARRRDRHEATLPCRRRRAQLRRQRQGAARRRHQRHLDPAGGRRCRRRASAPRSPPAISTRSCRARRPTVPTACRAPISARPTSRPISSSA